MKFDTMLFDLDGTLVDTAPDLVGALNYILNTHSRNKVDPTIAKQYVSKGAKALVRFGFGIDDSHPMFVSYHQQLLAYYEQHIADYSVIFAGITEVLTRLKKWGIVTNKPTNLTHLLVKSLGLTPDVIVCGDSLSEKKPSSLPITYAMRQLGCTHTLMIGDDEVDYLSAKQAGIPSIMVDWGYSTITQWQYRITQPQELFEWIM